jgi:CubicO group peptidase (beta-lactamase class C family)
MKELLRMMHSLRRLGWVALLATSAVSVPPLHGQTVDTLDSALRARIDRIAAQVLEQRGVPSASVAVAKDGKLVYTHAYGKAHLDPDVAATPEMRYSLNLEAVHGGGDSDPSRAGKALAGRCCGQVCARTDARR